MRIPWWRKRNEFREQVLEQIERQTAAIETIARVLAVKDGS